MTTQQQFQMQLAQLSPDNQAKFWHGYNNLMGQDFPADKIPEGFYQMRMFICAYVHDSGMGLKTDVHLRLLFDKEKSTFTMGEMVALANGAEHAECNYANWIRNFGVSEEAVTGYQKFRVAMEVITEEINNVIEPYQNSTMKQLLNAQRIGLELGSASARPLGKEIKLGR
jgi:hypothetical protein